MKYWGPKYIFTWIVLLSIIFNSRVDAAVKSPAVSMRKIVSQALDTAALQSIRMAESLQARPGVLPKSITKDGELETSKASWWTSGFFAGQLWYLYQYKKDSALKHWADEYTQRVKSQMYTKNNHDVGFMIFCSFGNAYKATGDPAYKMVIDTAAQSLSTRFNPTVGAIRSWDFSFPGHKWQYPVIIDNMMNLEMLMWASHTFQKAEFEQIAVSHANKTLAYHFRPDYSCYHVVSYNTTTGMPEWQGNGQGYNDTSSWARGQAWALYGFTMMYRETKNPTYLNQANHIAHFILSHPHLAADKIPYWDFNAPDIPHAYRDASAGAIICSALIELGQYVKKKLANQYLAVAETQLRTLTSSKYRAKLGTNANFILCHSVGNMPNKTEIDKPLTYTDYYYVEALIRYNQYVLHKKSMKEETKKNHITSAVINKK